MDPLSDVLRVVRLDGAYFYAVEAAEPWSVEAAPARQLSPRIMPKAEHLISYHILTDGRCFGGLIGEDQKYAWLNNIVSVGVYRSLPRIIAYRVYRIL